MASAQVAPYKNTVGIGVDYMSLDGPDDLGLRYVARYARHIANDRIVLEGSLGYLSIKNRRLIINNVYDEGRPRERLTVDFTVSVDFLRHSRHALRLGAGPSIWYRKDDLLQSAQFSVQQNGTITDVTIVRNRIDETNFGYHIRGEYEYAFTPRTTLAGRVGIANLNQAGFSSIAGLTLGHRF
ncbi:hypothetical protein GCM10028819_44010 [Spirosoma humi]